MTTSEYQLVAPLTLVHPSFQVVELVVGSLKIGKDWIPMSRLLFNEAPVFAFRQARLAALEQAIQQAKDEFIGGRELEDAVSWFVERHSLTAPQLDRSNLAFRSGGVRQMQSSDGFGRSILKQVTVIQAVVPFSGNADLFRVQPSTYTFNPPVGQIVGNTVVLEYEEQGNADAIRSRVNNELNKIDQYLANLASDVAALQQELASRARQLVQERQARIKQHNDVLKHLQGGQ